MHVKNAWKYHGVCARGKPKHQLCQGLLQAQLWKRQYSTELGNAAAFFTRLIKLHMSQSRGNTMIYRDKLASLWYPVGSSCKLPYIYIYILYTITWIDMEPRGFVWNWMDVYAFIPICIHVYAFQYVFVGLMCLLLWCISICPCLFMVIPILVIPYQSTITCVFKPFHIILCLTQTQSATCTLTVVTMWPLRNFHE